ncbi:hypothetical protein HaLaN_01804 [Haematococcus lacustris]|uniref:Uncharacterized protein n=1 Tax=Haematococcus lacustris TaxID=44745 RepID=A0A699YA40_HAELA|nr:hypothetical protein HaLaN_01804 [Haematococcus lacustris]
MQLPDRLAHWVMKAVSWKLARCQVRLADSQVVWAGGYSAIDGCNSFTFTAERGRDYFLVMWDWWNNFPSPSTCGQHSSWYQWPSSDFTYLLLGDAAAPRRLTLETCVPGTAAWDTVLVVVRAKPPKCGQRVVRGGRAGRSWGCASKVLYIAFAITCHTSGVLLRYEMVALRALQPRTALFTRFIAIYPAILRISAQFSFTFLPERCFEARSSYKIKGMNLCHTGPHTWSMTDDDSSPRGRGCSRLSFTAAVGQDYFIIVEGFKPTEVRPGLWPGAASAPQGAGRAADTTRGRCTQARPGIRLLCGACEGVAARTGS